MYETHFRLHRRPFSPSADTNAYVGIGPIEDARQNVVRTVERASGPAAVIGGAGTGKTMLCQVIAEQFEQQMQVAVLANGRLGSPRALYQAILFELNLAYREMDENELRLSLIDHLSDDEQCPGGVLLIIDEAHLLPLRLLEEVRMLTNVVDDGKPRVRLIIAGGPVLEERLNSPKLESFNQRIAARCYLDSFNREQTSAYIQEQLAMAGAPNKELFGGEALKAVYDATDGIPRLVNQLCDHALVMAAVGRHRAVDGAVVQEAWSDLQQLPTPWVEPSAKAQPVLDDGDVVEFGALSDDTDDASPASIPFPSRDNPAAVAVAKADEDSILSGPDEQLDEIERQVASVAEADVEREISPAMEVAATIANPFDETFDEEEVIVDSYASLQDTFFADAPRVRSDEGRKIAAMLATAEQPRDFESFEPPAAEPNTRVVAVDESDEQRESVAHAIAIDQREAHRRQQELTADVAAILPKEVAASEQWDSNVAMHRSAPPTDINAERRHIDPHGDDRDLIIVSQQPDDEVEADASTPNQSPTRRQKYRQLFARLRQA